MAEYREHEPQVHQGASGRLTNPLQRLAVSFVVGQRMDRDVRVHRDDRQFVGHDVVQFPGDVPSLSSQSRIHFGLGPLAQFPDGGARQASGAQVATDREHDQ